jgi:O-succinylbenzoic acid--CoA ligase
MLDGSGDVLDWDGSPSGRLVDRRATVELGFSGVIVTTSGSSGHPKAVMLSRDALVEAATASQERLGGSGIWVNPLPLRYVAGLMTAVRAIVAGRGYVDADPHLSDLPGVDQRAYVSVVPAQLHAGLADREITAKLRQYAAVLVGGAALSAEECDRARDAGVAVVTTYGMSETCGGVVYDGVPLNRVTVDVAPAPDRQAGRISITTATAFSGYVGDPQLTGEVLAGRTVLTQDLGTWADGRLVVTGRVDDVIQSGGVNVDLSEVQSVLDRAYPQATACFGVPDPVWGSTVVVASTGPGLDELAEVVVDQLGSPAKPRAVMTVAALPRTASGKIDRIGLVDQWRERHGESA